MDADLLYNHQDNNIENESNNLPVQQPDRLTDVLRAWSLPRDLCQQLLVRMETSATGRKQTVEVC